jgi:hypothetical protein
MNNYFANKKNQGHHARNADAIVACTIQCKNINSIRVFSLGCDFKITPSFQMKKLEKNLILYLGKYGI